MKTLLTIMAMTIMATAGVGVNPYEPDTYNPGGPYTSSDRHIIVCSDGECKVVFIYD